MQVGAIHRPTNLVVHPGGKGLNVARAAARLGASVTAVALLAGHAGRWIAERLPLYGIEAHMAWAAGETRSCLSIYDRATQQLTEFYEPAGAVTTQEWTGLEAVLESTLEQAGANDLLALCGTAPPGAPLNSHGRLVALARARGVRTIVDGYGRALHDALAAGAWGIKINAAEAAAATGMTISDGDSALAAAVRLRSLGAQAVVITLGRQGVAAIDESGRAWMVSRIPAEGRYPVGSGDAFLAGMAVALLGGSSLATAVQTGTAAAAANAEQPGAGVLDRHRVAVLADRVAVTAAPRSPASTLGHAGMNDDGSE